MMEVQTVPNSNEIGMVEGFKERRPPGVKKSCSICVKMKLRCSGDFPSCTRCSRLQRSCEYERKKKKPKLNEEAEIVCPEGHQGCYGQCIFRLIGNNRTLLLKPLTRKGMNKVWHLFSQFCDEQRANVDISFRPELALKLMNTSGQQRLAWSLFHKIAVEYMSDANYGGLCFDLRHNFRTCEMHFKSMNSNDAKTTFSKLLAIENDAGLSLSHYFSRLPYKYDAFKSHRQRISKETFNNFVFVSFSSDELLGFSSNINAVPLTDADIYAEVRSWCVSAEWANFSQQQPLPANSMAQTMFIDFKRQLFDREGACRLPTMFMRTMNRNWYNPSKRETNVVANLAFENVFTMKPDYLFQDGVAQFLPYGASILSGLVADEADLLTFIQEQSVKCSLAGFRMNFPWVTEFPNISFVTLNVRKSLTSNEVIPIKCSVTVLCRKLQDEFMSVEETFIQIRPDCEQDISHLFDDDFLGEMLNTMS